jgi:tripartite-type tricarboxylate transporter receptor subunit TctC
VRWISCRDAKEKAMRLMPSALAALIAGCLTLVSLERAIAQNYPTHPVRIIVSSAAGGPLDIVGRAVAEKMAAALKQPVVVEARSGAGGNIAADFVSKSAPDGYTLLFTLSSTLTVNPHLYKDLTFNLKPVTVVNYSTQTLFVHPSVPVHNVGEFVAWAKKEGPVSYAHGGNGTSSHLVMEYFRLLAGFETVGVPYRGAAAMVSDFLAGQFKVAFGSTSGLLPQAAAGKLRALAVSTSKRSPLAPDVPTVAESGYPGFELTTDFVLLAPGATPDEIVALLEREVRQAIDTTEFRDRFSKQDIWIVASTSVEAASRIKAGFDLWRDVVVRTGMKSE